MKFKQIAAQYLERLEQFVPIVARVHGPHHPEFYDVQKVFNEISAKITAAGGEKPELAPEFTQLREITTNYLVPDDVCETYEAVYSMLAELDAAYHE